MVICSVSISPGTKIFISVLSIFNLLFLFLYYVFFHISNYPL